MKKTLRSGGRDDHWGSNVADASSRNPRERRLVFGLRVRVANGGPELSVVRSSPLFQTLKLHAAGHLDNGWVGKVRATHTICHGLL